MQQIIQKWGNSLALRIPKNIASENNLSRGSTVNIYQEGGRLIIEPVKKNKYSLDKLLAQVSEENKHSEIDTGEPAGEEIW